MLLRLSLFSSLLHGTLINALCWRRCSARSTSYVVHFLIFFVAHTMNSNECVSKDCYVNLGRRFLARRQIQWNGAKCLLCLRDRLRRRLSKASSLGQCATSYVP